MHAGRRRRKKLRQRKVQEQMKDDRWGPLGSGEGAGEVRKGEINGWERGGESQEERGEERERR